jgi:exopolysaccharide biosynthesis polyprenyl glycosylphosphotransferase
MLDFIRGNKINARWPASTPTGGTLDKDEARVADKLEEPIVRRKTIGLRPGERKLLQAITDWVVTLSGAFVIGLQSGRVYHGTEVVLSGAILAALWFFFANAFDAYDITVLQNHFRSAYKGGKVFLVTGTAYVLVAGFTGGTLPVIRPRISESLLALFLVGPVVMILRTVAAQVLNHAPLRRRVAVVGANESGYEMVQALSHYGGRTYEFLGYFDDQPAEPVAGADGPPPTAQPIAELLRLNSEQGIDQIVLANPDQTPELLRAISICHERGIQITPMFALYQELTGRVPVSYLGRDWFVALPAHVKSTARTYLVLKRLVDLTLGLVLMTIAAPLIPIIALAIKLDSPGPVFFKQVRAGRGGKPFKIVKFRSMRQDAEAGTGAVWASSADSRITRMGKIMRGTRLDELPQLWNVVVGDMSFVGPRPERPELEERLEREIPFYRARRAVRPGLTGWAQVRHGYGNTMRDALRKVEFDLYYIKNESLYHDLLIMLRTISVIIRRSGA